MKPKYITIHCSASYPKTAKHETASDIRAIHVKKGWSDIGYHYFIRRDGSVEKGRLDDKQGAHVKGHNKDNLGICLAGGVDDHGKAEANYTDAQYNALYGMLLHICYDYKIKYSDVRGHRDWYPDHNGDGVIDSRDWLKVCPCFDVRAWFKQQLKLNEVI